MFLLVYNFPNDNQVFFWPKAKENTIPLAVEAWSLRKFIQTYLEA